MGMMVEGAWRDDWYDTRVSAGAFVRPETAFRNRVSADGSTGFPAAAGRYHLYVSFACPWAHRTLVVRALKGLEDALPMSAVDPDNVAQGWAFTGAGGTTLDRANGCRFLHEVYRLARSDYTGRVTVPVLWDTQEPYDRQQRVGRDHPHAEPGVRRVRGARLPRPLPARAPRRDRRRSTTASTGR